MSAAEIMEQIKELSADEQAQVARFISENGGLITGGIFQLAQRPMACRSSAVGAGSSPPNSFRSLKV
jgi:hypothetical protein